MKIQVIYLVLSLLSMAVAVDLPHFRSLHNLCSQNLPCTDGMVCRRDIEAVYGTCEKPPAQPAS